MYRAHSTRKKELAEAAQAAAASGQKKKTAGPQMGGKKMRKKDVSTFQSARKCKLAKEVLTRLLDLYIRRRYTDEESEDGLYGKVLSAYNTEHDCGWTADEIQNQLREALKYEHRVWKAKVREVEVCSSTATGSGGQSGAGADSGATSGAGAQARTVVKALPTPTVSTRGAGAGTVQQPISEVRGVSVQQWEPIVSRSLFTDKEEADLCDALRYWMEIGIRIYECELAVTIRRLVEAKYGSLNQPFLKKWGCHEPGFPSPKWFAGFCGRNDFVREKAEGRSTFRIQCATQQTLRTFGTRLAA